MILRIETDTQLDIEKINSFFKLFSKDTDKIKLLKTSIKNSKTLNLHSSNLDSTMFDFVFNNLQKSSILFEDENIYKIVVIKQKIKSFFCTEKFEDINVLFKHIAFHFGFTQCLCKGFSVKDKNKNKINVEDFIYIKNSINFDNPKLLTYIKLDKIPKNLFFDKFKSANFITESKIVTTILQTSELFFQYLNTIYKLTENGTQIYEYNFVEFNFFGRINYEKEKFVIKFLEEHKKEYLNIIKILYIDKNYFEYTKKVTEFKKLINQNKDIFWYFILDVPIFNDIRDDFTAFIISQYDKFERKTKNKRKGSYLDISEEKTIERMYSGSLKHYLYNYKTSF